MRRLVILLAALPAVALAADDRQASAPAAPPARTVVAQAMPAPAPLISPTPAAITGDSGDCRMSCAQTYYFCRAGQGQDDCAQPWSQCVAACDLPSLASPVSTQP